MALTDKEVEVLKKQLERQKRRARPGTVEGSEQSKANAASYYKDLEVIVKALEKSVKDTVFPAIKSRAKQLQDAEPVSVEQAITAAEKLFMSYRDWEKYAVKIASKAATIEAKHARTYFVKEIKEAIGVDIRDVLSEDAVRKPVEASIKSNFDLIKTIPEQYYDRARVAMVQGIAQGDDAFSLFDALKDAGVKTDNRARLIARDQMSKLNSAINRAQQEDIGVTSYRWRTSKDERVRKSHAKNDGRQFDWDNPPPDTGHPGEDVQCRCTADPDLSPLLGILANR